MEDPARTAQALGPAMLDAARFPTMRFDGRCAGAGVSGALDLHGTTGKLAARGTPLGRLRRLRGDPQAAGFRRERDAVCGRRKRHDPVHHPLAPGLYTASLEKHHTWRRSSTASLGTKSPEDALGRAQSRSSTHGQVRNQSPTRHGARSASPPDAQ